MGFLIYDIVFLVLFSAFVIWFLYTRRKNVEREGLLYLYRTSFGLKTINWTSKKFKKTLSWLQYVSIGMGYLLMGLMMFLFFQLVYIYIRNPQIVRAVKIPPIMPLIPYLPSVFKLDFLPPFYFAYWILILAVVAIVHEFAHGIFARLHDIKVKSTGFGFLGPFLAAFVEPDEEQMKKKSILSQLSVLTAGTFANILISILFIIVFVLFFMTMFTPAGAVFNTYMYSAVNLSGVDSVNNILVINPSPQGILENLDWEDERNLTEIRIDDKIYLLDNNRFAGAVDSIEEMAIVYDDAPAIRAGLKGDIIEFDGEKITGHEDLSEAIEGHFPGDEVSIKTKIEGEVNEYEIKLGNNNGEPYIGVGLNTAPSKGIRGKIFSILSFVKKPGTFYEQKYDGDFIIFIYDFLWWMILINISVALVNMLPLGIFDGGRVFYLTIFAFTKSEMQAKKVFKFMTMFLLSLLAIIMLFWFFSVF